MIHNLFILLFLTISTTSCYYISDEDCLNYTVYPVQYDITIKPILYSTEKFYYDCDLVITVIANAPYVEIIELDAEDLDLKEDSIEVLDGKINIVDSNRPYEYDKKRGKLFIYLNNSLKQYSLYKTQYYIKISFSKFVDYDSSGVFPVKFDDRGPRYLFTTRLSPFKAKYFFPCFNNVKFESVFKFKVLETPPRAGIQYTNVSLVIAEELKRTSSKSYNVIEYKPSPQVSIYQVGFHHSQFDNRKVNAAKTNDSIVLWAPARALHHYTFILSFGESFINAIHEYSTIKRPIVVGPINVIAVPSNLHGYEIGSWNLLTNGDTKLAYVEQFTSVKQLEKMTFQLAQHLCSIWLGNPGESERTRWKEEWFKLGVATYLAYYFLSQINHQTHTVISNQPLGMYGMEMKQKAMAVDWHHSTPTLISFNRTLAVEITPQYHELVTMKTASVLWMVDNWLGSDKFHKSFIKYLNSRRGKYVSLQDFTANLDHDTKECLNEQYNGSTASQVLYSWFKQSGYPVVYVQVLRDRSPNAIQLVQHQFSFFNKTHVDSNFLIPISYIVQNKENCFNCYDRRFTIGNTYTFEENLNDGWIIINKNASGYFRVNYDEFTWRLIAKSLKYDFHLIDELNRAQIVYDVFALYVAGEIHYDLAMDILDYLQKETSSIVWESVMAGFGLLKVHGSGCHMTKATYEQWQDFMRRKISIIFNKLFNDHEKFPNNRMFRSNIIEIACYVNYRPCITKLQYLFYNYANKKERLDPDFRESCYYMVLKENKGDLGIDKINRFEEEDKIIAEHRVNEDKKFWYRTPEGIPKPMSIVSTSAPYEITTHLPFSTTTPSSSETIKVPILMLIFFLFCLCC